MYAFVDQPVDRLCNGSRFVLWAMRSWGSALDRGCCPPGALAGAFSRMGALSALPSFHLAMAFFNRDKLEPIAFAALDHPDVAEDEAVLLAMWRDVALGDVDRARATLALLVEEDSLASIQQAIVETTLKLAAAGCAPTGLTDTIMKEAK